MEHRQLIVGGVIGAFALVAGLWLWSQPGEPEKSSPATTPRTELAPAPPPPPPREAAPIAPPKPPAAPLPPPHMKRVSLEKKKGGG